MSRALGPTSAPSTLGRPPGALPLLTRLCAVVPTLQGPMFNVYLLLRHSVLTLSSGAVNLSQHLFPEVLRHCLNTWFRSCWRPARSCHSGVPSL